MSTLRISDAPLLPDVDGTEKIPTGGRGDYAVSVDQLKTFAQGGLPQQLEDHINDTSNPHQVTKDQVGLGNVDNTSDINKPVSTATQEALDLKANQSTTYTKTEVDQALDLKADLVGGVVPSEQLPSYVDDVIEVTTDTLPVTGESGKIYVTTDTNRTWRWSGSQYVEISNGGISDSTIKLQNARKIANVDFDGTQDISIPHNNFTDRDTVGAHPASAISDVSGKSQQEINNEYALRFKTVVDPRNFGAPNNGVDDDAQGVREAVAYLDSIGGGELYMRSNVPWQFLTLSSNNQDAVVIKSRILVNFGDYSSTIQVGTAMRAVFKIVEDGGTYHAFCGWQGGLIQGANLAEYGLYSDPNSYTPYMSVKGIQLRNFTEAAASLNPYMSTFEMSHFSFSKRGLVLNNSGQMREITSTTISNCYANGCEEVGFKAADRMTYSSLQNCGVDQCNGIAYDLDMLSGSIIDCGAERVVQLARFPNINDGVRINGLVGVSVGSLNPETPTPAAIEFTGASPNENLISGVRLLTSTSETRYYDKKLSVHATLGKYPRVRILDNSITQQEVISTVQSGLESPEDDPIKFTYTPFTRSRTETLLPSALKARLDGFNKTVNNYTHVIQLSDGSEDLEKIINRITGTGILVIRGNASDRSLVKLRGARLGLTISNCPSTIILQNLTLENTIGYSDSTLAQLVVDNCACVILDNVGFSSPSYIVGTAIRARNNSRVYLRNGTSADDNHSAAEVYQELSGSVITIEPMPAPPSTGRWKIGQRIKNSTIGTGNIIEWVYVRKADNTGSEWRAITV